MVRRPDQEPEQQRPEEGLMVRQMLRGQDQELEERRLEEERTRRGIFTNMMEAYCLLFM